MHRVPVHLLEAANLIFEARTSTREKHESPARGRYSLPSGLFRAEAGGDQLLHEDVSVIALDLDNAVLDRTARTTGAFEVTC